MPRRKRPRSHDTKFYKYYGCCGACIPNNIQQLFVDASVRHLCLGLCENQKFLAHVYLPFGLQSIGKFAFRGCEQLQAILIPSTVETIGESAFWACSSLSEVDLPQELKVIDQNAFLQCIRLWKIKIPSTVEVIQRGAFHSCSALTIVELKDGLQEIGENAFLNCISLAAIEIPKTVVKILDYAFALCQNLRNVEFAVVYSDSDGVKELGDFVFLDCTLLTRIRLPDSIESIGNCCFKDCVSLVTVEIEYGMKGNFGHGVFHGCRKLTNISLDEIESRLSACCFTECEYLLEHYGQDNLVDGLKDRFRNCAVHESCYHEYNTGAFDLDDVLADTIVNFVYKDPDDSDDDCDESSEATAASTKNEDDEFKETVDSFGRSPFHILASSATKDRIDLMETLLNTYPSYMLSWKDKYGMCAVDYLPCGDDKSWDAWYEMMLQKWMIERLFKWGKDHWISRLAALVHATVHHDRQNLATAKFVLEGYETQETTSLLELWLWRMQVLVVKKQLFFSRQKVDRKLCRSLSGASFVIPTVMEFLGVDKRQLFVSDWDDSESESENESEEGYDYHDDGGEGEGDYYHNGSEDEYDY